MIHIAVDENTPVAEIALYSQTLQALSELRAGEAVPVEAPAVEESKPAKAKKTKAAPVQEPAAETPAPVASPAEVSEPVQEQAPQTEELKLEDVRALLTGISRGGKTAEVKALLQEFGKEKLTDIEPQHYAALVEKAKAL